jgi:hypothetical protein
VLSSTLAASKLPTRLAKAHEKKTLSSSPAEGHSDDDDDDEDDDEDASRPALKGI